MKTTYKTVRSKETADLDEKVNAEMEKGFMLHGGPYSTGDGWMCQAMVKEEKNKPSEYIPKSH